MDDSTRAALREAEASGSGPAWFSVAHALLRAGELAEAARAARGAMSGGEDAHAILDALCPAIAAFEVAPGSVELPYAVFGDGVSAVWDARGERTFLGVGTWSERKDSIHAIDVATRTAEPATPPLPWYGGEPRAIATSLHAGELLAASRSAERWDVVRVDLAAETISAPIGPRHACPRGLAFLGDVYVCAESGRAHAYPLDATSRTRPLWKVEGVLQGGLDPCGALVTANEREVALYRALEPEPRVRMTRPGSLYRRALPVGLRALLVDEDLRLIGSRGEELGRAAIPDDYPAIGRPGAPGRVVVPAPSGRLALVVSDAFRLVDLGSSAVRPLHLEGNALAAAWSPCGRRLAVVTQVTGGKATVRWVEAV